jgi:hypothetical protein
MERCLLSGRVETLVVGIISRTGWSVQRVRIPKDTVVFMLTYCTPSFLRGVRKRQIITVTKILATLCVLIGYYGNRL